MFSGLESPWHLLIVLLVGVIVFGPKRMPELGRSLGGGIRGFKSALEGDEETAPATVTESSAAENTVIPAGREGVGDGSDPDAP